MISGNAKKFAALVKKLRAAGDAAPEGDSAPEHVCPVLHELVYSLLLWEASSGQARSAIKRVREHLVDYNELRVCMPADVAQALGERYPLAWERALRLRAVLQDIYTRQQDLSLSHLVHASKREARQFLDSLEGCPQFAWSRTGLVCAGLSVIPVDERLRDLLAGEKIVKADDTPADVARWLEQQAEAVGVPSLYGLLQAWSDEHGKPPRHEQLWVISETTTAKPPVAKKRAARARRTGDPAPKGKPRSKT